MPPPPIETLDPIDRDPSAFDLISKRDQQIEHALASNQDAPASTGITTTRVRGNSHLNVDAANAHIIASDALQYALKNLEPGLIQ